MENFGTIFKHIFHFYYLCIWENLQLKFLFYVWCSTHFILRCEVLEIMALKVYGQIVAWG